MSEETKRDLGRRSDRWQRRTSRYRRVEFTAAETEHNTSILESFDYDLATDIDAYPGETISPGSELRPPGQLEPLLRHHPTWQEFHVHADMLFGKHSTPNRGRQAHRPARQTRKDDALVVFRYRLRMAVHKHARARAHPLCGAVFFATKLRVRLRRNDRPNDETH